MNYNEIISTRGESLLPVINQKLSSKRYIHSINVAQTAFELAEKSDNADIANKAYVAGLLHDIMKEEPPESLKRIVAEATLFEPDTAELETMKLWHAVAGAVYVRDELKIDDVDLLNAVRFHTIGRENMSSLEKIVYLADKTSADRKYKDVSEIRALADKNINSAMFECVKANIKKCLKKEKKIPSYTVKAFNQLCDINLVYSRSFL